MEEPVEGITGLAVHEYHIWDVDKVKAFVADQEEAVTFFCGGSRKRSSPTTRRR